MTTKKIKKETFTYLECGCGANKSSVEALFQQTVIKPEHKDNAVVIGVDMFKCEGVDKVFDLTKAPYPFKDNSIDGAFSNHFLEHLDGHQRITFFNEMYRILKKGARMRHIHPHYRSVRAVQDPTHCFADDTDVLTENGWKKLTSVAIGENIITLNQKTRESELSPCINVIQEKYIGEMVQFKNISMDMLVTPNHSMGWWSGGDVKASKWNVSDASTFLPLKGHHSRRADAILKWTGIDIDTIEIPLSEYSKGKNTNPNKFNAEDFMSFMGWFVAEGTAGEKSKPTSTRICISQSQSANKAKCNEIESLITKMGFKANVDSSKIRFASKCLVDYLKPLGDQTRRYIPSFLKQLSPRLLNILLMSAIKGDGNKNGGRNDSWRYATISKHLADDIMEIALKIGYRVSMSVEKRGLQYVNGNSKISDCKDMYSVYITKAQTLSYPKADKVFYDGNIACITVAHNNIIMVRRNGRVLWSGNCWPPIAPESYAYWGKAWRDANKLGHYLGNCDFEVIVYNSGYHDPIWSTKVKEQQDFATNHYNNIIQDLIADMIKI